MSERLEKIADEILAVVNKKRVSGETPEKDVWVATYLPNREQIAVIFGDREVSGSYVQKRFNKDDKKSIISALEKLYGAEPRNHNEEGLDEDTVYDHSWYEVEDGDYPKRTKEGVMIKEDGKLNVKDYNGTGYVCPSEDNLWDIANLLRKNLKYRNTLEWQKSYQSLKNANPQQYIIDWANGKELQESIVDEGMCAGCVASVGKSVKPLGKYSKRKRKKVSEDIHSKLFKESILNDMPCEAEVEGHQFKYFMNEGKWYLSVDNCLVKTHNKGVMMETFDQIVDNEKVTTSLLEDYSCYEMELLMEDEDAFANPMDSDTPMTSNPENTSASNSSSPGDNAVDSISQNDIIANIGSKMNQLDDKENEIKSSEDEAEKELHNQEVLSAENQQGTVPTEDGGSIDITIGKTETIKDKDGKDMKITHYKDNSGKDMITKTDNISKKEF